jgi:hypothetical protein
MQGQSLYRVSRRWRPWPRQRPSMAALPTPARNSQNPGAPHTDCTHARLPCELPKPRVTKLGPELCYWQQSTAAALSLSLSLGALFSMWRQLGPSVRDDTGEERVLGGAAWEPIWADSHPWRRSRNVRGWSRASLRRCDFSGDPGWWVGPTLKWRSEREPDGIATDWTTHSPVSYAVCAPVMTSGPTQSVAVGMRPREWSWAARDKGGNGPDWGQSAHAPCLPFFLFSILFSFHFQFKSAPNSNSNVLWQIFIHRLYYVVTNSNLGINSYVLFIFLFHIIFVCFSFLNFRISFMF